MTSTGLACSACGVGLPLNSKFCTECGTAVSAAAKAAEYKQVTVLFADVVRSMDIAASVGAERLREIMAELVDRCAAVVSRFGGTVDKFTGDGIMAVFGAPVALEDHAVRACLAALGVQEEAQQLAVDIHDRFGVDLRLRVGLNSGEVIAGELGSGPFGYTAVGEQVGMAQRMESVAPPGGVMLSASTARLVGNTAELGEPEVVQIKGAEAAVPARRLLSMGERTAVGGAESNLVGRRWELSAVESLLERAADGNGAVVGVAGPPGIGKSRLVREVAAMAGSLGVEVFTAFCESHTSQIPFHAVARLLRAAIGVQGLGGQVARDRVRDRVPDADPEDLLLFEDLLGIADPNTPLPAIDPDARRRRLTALVNTASLARGTPAVYVVEDAHWIDEVSDSMLADFIRVIPQTPSLMLFTYRPEYRGALTNVAGAHTLALTPLSDIETAALITELLGPDPSVGALGLTIADRAAGNPFFVEEIVRELAERGALLGQIGAYISTAEADVSVPATLQATIAARIDRLPADAKRTLSAAAVIGSRFDLDLLTVLGVEPAIADLTAAQLVDQVSFTGEPEFVFHHPLIRAVAYEAQLKSHRAELHLRLAAAIEARAGALVDEHAALIAEHLEAAGDLRNAYDWHMRAATWATNRDIRAARVGWERARRMADALPADEPNRTVIRLAPRTLLCGSAWRILGTTPEADFHELRELCLAVDDKRSLAVAMAGLATELTIAARLREASELASELMTLLEAIGDSTLTVALCFAPMVAKHETGELSEVLRWSQAVVELAGGDPTMGNLIIESPLALALAWRGIAKASFGLPGWRDDFDLAVELARDGEVLSPALAINFKYNLGIPNGVWVADDAALSEIHEALTIAKKSGDDVALGMSLHVLATVMAYHDNPDRQPALEVMDEVRQMSVDHRFTLTAIPIIDAWKAQEQARQGDRDGALGQLRAVVSELRSAPQFARYIAAAPILLETLLSGADEADLREAEAVIDQLASTAGDDLVFRDIMLLRLRTMLAQARGDGQSYREHRDNYRAMAKSLGFEGHIKWAEAML
ncbi:MAG: adenylate/guanylate cyclase domain-containing protein [Mycobacterium sp.]